MIYSISGLLRQVAPTYCVVEACGVGYQCSASTHTLSSLPGRGQEVTLLTHLWVKEDGMELFGFSTEQERRCFRMLIGVSGVGPRVALAILSDSAPDRLMLSIAAGDAKALTRAQGVGAKLAQRIILELRDKVSDEDISMPFSDEIGTISTVAETIHNTAKSEAISALVALGYGQTDAAAVIAQTYDTPPLAYVRSYGCQQNVNDGEKIRGVLMDIGFGICDSVEQADLILFNTCAVREHAEQRVFGNVGALKKLKEKNPRLIIGVCGCMAQQKHIVDKLRASYPYVDLVFGVDGIDRLPAMLVERLHLSLIHI